MIAFGILRRYQQRLDAWLNNCSSCLLGTWTIKCCWYHQCAKN